MAKTIKQILGRGFKGLTFLEELDQFNLFIAPNGTGKSARSQALQLAVLGYLPGDGKRVAGDIYRAHSADGQPFTVGFRVRHDEAPAGLARFERTFTANGLAGASQDITINGKKCKANDAGKVLAKLGDPAIFDAAGFNSLSDQKKIDLIFELFPPEGDPAALEEKLSKIAVQISTQKVEVAACTRSIERLTGEVAQIEVPAGTLAEVRAEIEAKGAAQDEARKQLQDLREAEAQERGRQEAEVSAADAADLPPAAPAPEAGPIPAGTLAEVRVAPAAPALPGQDPRASLQRIMETMQDAGCDACAAVMVLRKEMRRYPEGAHHG